MQELSSSRQRVSLENHCAFVSSFCAVLSNIEFVAVQIRELQHELGGKNGILKALKLELMVNFSLL